jgi:hypothetical protein
MNIKYQYNDNEMNGAYFIYLFILLNTRLINIKRYS